MTIKNRHIIENYPHKISNATESWVRKLNKQKQNIYEYTWNCKKDRSDRSSKFQVSKNDGKAYKYFLIAVVFCSIY